MRIILYTTHSYEKCLDRLRNAADMRSLLNPLDWFIRCPSGKPVIGWMCGHRFQIERPWFLNRINWQNTLTGFYGKLRGDKVQHGTWIEGRYSRDVFARGCCLVVAAMVLLTTVITIAGYLNHQAKPQLRDIVPLLVLFSTILYYRIRRNPYADEFLVDFLKRTLEATEQPPHKG